MIDSNIKAIISNPFKLACDDDIEFLIELEKECFDEEKRFSKKIFLNSIKSLNQLPIIISDKEGNSAGAMIVRIYKKTLRITTIAISRNYQGKGFGGKFINLAFEILEKLNFDRILIEVEKDNLKLIKWYEYFGFIKKQTLKDYYGIKRDAVKMEYIGNQINQYIVVTDYATDFFDGIECVKQIRVNEYIENGEYQYRKNIKVFNMCNSYRYQSVGYYVSLLALARNQVSYPSTGFIRDIHNQRVIKSIGEEIHNLIQSSFKCIEVDKFEVDSYFNKSSDKKYNRLINSLHSIYHIPLIRYYFVKKKQWYLNGMKIISLKEAIYKVEDKLYVYAKEYFENTLFNKRSFKKYNYDLAILVDYEEKIPPSNEIALKKFEKAAQDLGFYVEYITKKDYSRLPEFDALFIRTTTNVNHYTYDFSRYAYAEGLVVIDDPWSILRCANKIFLYEALKNANVLMPQTFVFNKKSNYKEIIDKCVYPFILKLPDSAFSEGVYKVKNRSECYEKLAILFKKSDLVIAQEYIPTDYDWRIGVINGEIIYACKYYMVKGHWQIVSWEKDKKGYQEGDDEAVLIDEVPIEVRRVALKAAKVIGDGLYGIDIKLTRDLAYVIEVNDNPNIDSGVEDNIEKDQIYKKIMKFFIDKLNNNFKESRTIV